MRIEKREKINIYDNICNVLFSISIKASSIYFLTLLICSLLSIICGTIVIEDKRSASLLELFILIKKIKIIIYTFFYMFLSLYHTLNSIFVVLLNYYPILYHLYIISGLHSLN